MAASTGSNPILYAKNGKFMHPKRFLQTRHKSKDAKGNEVTTTMFRKDYYTNMVFDEDDPLNPEKNNIVVEGRTFDTEKGKRTEYEIQWRDKSLKAIVTPPLAVTSTDLGPNGNWMKGGRLDPDEQHPAQARYTVCLGGAAYDEAVKSQTDPYQRNQDFVDFVAWAHRLKRWVYMVLWNTTEDQIHSNARNDIKDDEKHDRAEKKNFKGYSKEEVIKRFEKKPERSRDFVKIPAAKDDDQTPPESRSYVAIGRRVFAKLKDPSKTTGFKALPAVQIDDDPCPPGFRRMPLRIVHYNLDVATGVAKPSRMTRPEINQIQRGDVMACMVNISLGLDDPNPDKGWIFSLNMHIDGANNDDMYFGPGNNSAYRSNADLELQVAEPGEMDEDTEMPDVAASYAAAASASLVPENAESPVLEEPSVVPMDAQVDSPSTQALKRKGRSYDDEEEEEEQEQEVVEEKPKGKAFKFARKAKA